MRNLSSVGGLVISDCIGECKIRTWHWTCRFKDQSQDQKFFLCGRPLIGEREIRRIGMETFGKFRCHEEVTERRIILSLPCPFHPCLMGLLLPCLETSYLTMRYLFLFFFFFPFIKTIFLVAHYVSLVCFLFPKHLSISFILINTFACFWALGRMLLCQVFVCFVLTIDNLLKRLI